MNRRAMFKRNTLLLALAGALLLTACNRSEEPPLAGAAIGGPFTLIDSSGKQVHWSDFAGKYRIVYFGYTYCPAACPTDVLQMMQGYTLLKQQHPDLAAKIQPLFITIDPARDTPAKVGEFTHAFSNDLLGLTGTPDEIRKTATEFGVFFQKGKTNPDGGYDMDHSRSAYLMGRKGEPIALLPIDKGREAVAEDLARWTS